MRTKRERSGWKKGVYILPNLLTTCSLYLGLYSIILSMKGDLYNAAIAILGAVIFDGVDGRIARFTNSTSRFGVEYDSLADLLSFGIAPSIFVYTWALKPYGRWGWAAIFLYTACGALRLARFNVQFYTSESKGFRGLPIPAAASFIATMYLFVNHFRLSGQFRYLIILITIYILGFLMVSSIRYHSFKDFQLLRKKPFETLVAVVLLIFIVVAEPYLILFIISSIYIISGPAEGIIRLLWKRKALPKKVLERRDLTN